MEGWIRYENSFSNLYIPNGWKISNFLMGHCLHTFEKSKVWSRNIGKWFCNLCFVLLNLEYVCNFWICLLFVYVQTINRYPSEHHVAKCKILSRGWEHKFNFDMIWINNFIRPKVMQKWKALGNPTRVVFKMAVVRILKPK